MKKKQMKCSQNRSKDSIGSVLSTENAFEGAVRAERVLRAVGKMEERRMR
jgi:hypothetical protein